MEVRQVMRRLMPAARSRAVEPAKTRSNETKVVLADYYAALASAGLYNAYRSRPWPVERAVTEAYERIVWVYKSVEAVSGHAARLPFLLKQGDDVLDDHPLYRVMNKRANPLETGQQFRKRLSAQILLSKRGAFVEVTKSRSGDIVRLDLLPPGRTRPVPGDGQTLIDRYEVMRADGTVRKIDVENVRWFREAHPLDPYSGVTPLEAAGLSVELDFFTRLYNVAFLRNDARPGGVLAVNGEMDPDEMDRIEDKFAKGPSEAGKLTVIAGEVSYVDMAAAPRDMQYETTSTTSKKEILSAFGVPESVIGDASGRTWDNAEVELHNFWSITMPPHLDLLISGLDEDSDDDLQGYFDTEEIEVLQRGKKARREEARTEFEAGLISIDEYREIAGYEPVDNEHTRALYVAQSKTPVPTSKEDAEAFGLAEKESMEQEAEVAAAQQAPPEEPTAKPEDKPEGTPKGGAGGDLKEPAAKKHLSVLPGHDEPPPEFARPLIRLIRPVEAKAAARHAESLPDAAARDTLESALAATLTALSVRLTARAATRLASPKARKGTRHWVAEMPVDYRTGVKAVDAEQAVDPDRWQEETEQTLYPLLEAAALAAGAALLADLGALPPAVGLAAVVAPVALAVARLLGSAARDKAKKLITLIREADEAGTPMADLTATVRGYATSMTSWANAASVSAATATVNGSRDAAAQAWVDEGPGRDVVRMWKHRGDVRVRPSHLAAGGQIRPLGERFKVGQALLRYPGDPVGPIEETANCRCAVVHRSSVTGKFAPAPPGEITKAPKKIAS